MAFSGNIPTEPPAQLAPAMLTALCLPGLILDADELPLLKVTAGKRAFTFRTEYRRIGTPQQIELARGRAMQVAREVGALPLVVVPYLSEERLLGLEREGVSGLDLCGNAVLISPGSLYVFRTGFPNRFKSSAPIKNVFRGSSSLVARSFLLRPEFASVGQIGEEITARGGELSPGTVSKALKELEAQLLVGRASGQIRLLEPERLLERLEREFALPKVTGRFIGKAEVSFEAIQSRGVPVVRTGVGSATRYAALAMESTLTIYTTSLAGLLEGIEATATNRFPNLEVLETNDPTVYFDARDGFASPIQTYLEMRADDERLWQSASQVRERILTQ
jgi:hypothetical protein